MQVSPLASDRRADLLAIRGYPVEPVDVDAIFACPAVDVVEPAVVGGQRVLAGAAVNAVRTLEAVDVVVARPSPNVVIALPAVHPTIVALAATDIVRSDTPGALLLA